jgi:hypothetical protein
LIEPVAFGPYRFALTDEEARVAIARLALRYGLSRRFERDYVAPLAFFVLLLAFVAILAFTGLIARRSAELALLLGAIFFLASRFVAHLRLRRAQRLATNMVNRLTASGETTLTVGQSGLAFRHCPEDESEPNIFLGLTEIDDASGLLYLWLSGREEAPIVIPKRVFANSTEADRFLGFLRQRVDQGGPAHVP